MGNGFGPLLMDLNEIAYRPPFAIPDFRETYWVGSVWTSAENFVEINDPENQQFTLPSEVATKIAAAILLAKCREAMHPSWLLPESEALLRRLTDNQETLQAFAKLLEAILDEELDHKTMQDFSSDF